MYISIDCETTGLDCFSERIVEIAAILFEADGTEVEVFQTLINPGRPIPRDVTAIHGIDDLMVADAPSFAVVVNELLPTWIQSDLVAPAMIAHNAKFDVGFLKEEYKYAMRPIFPHVVYCTLEMAKQCYARSSARYNLKLGTLATQFGIDPAGAHRALADSRLCKGVFLELKRRFPLIVRI